MNNTTSSSTGLHKSALFTGLVTLLLFLLAITLPTPARSQTPPILPPEITTNATAAVFFAYGLMEGQYEVARYIKSSSPESRHLYPLRARAEAAKVMAVIASGWGTSSFTVAIYAYHWGRAVAYDRAADEEELYGDGD